MGVAEAEPRQDAEARQPPIVAERRRGAVCPVRAEHVAGAAQGALPTRVRLQVDGAMR